MICTAVLDIWSKQAFDVRGKDMDCGHFLAEEQPEAVLAELVPFLRS